MAIKKFLQKNIQAGVTLIEMIVVVGIIGLISSVIIFNYSDFSSNVSLRNLSQEIALSVRKAQTYATSVHAIDGLANVNSRTFKGYGISFAVNGRFNSGSERNHPSERRFVLFADVDLNSNYNPGDDCDSIPFYGSECLEVFSITNSDKIVEVCANIGGGRGGGGGAVEIGIEPIEQSDTRATCSKEAVIDITYRRPSPDANICYRSSADETKCQNASYATIWIESVKGLKKSITVYNTGQISVQ